MNCPTRRVFGVPAMLAMVSLAVGGRCLPAWAAQIQISGPIAGIPGLSSPTVAVQSYQARRFSAVIPQRFDYSCGSAALATLLTYSYGMPTGEMPVFRSMIVNGNKAMIEKYGFSLLDMKEYLQRIGLPSGGFRAPLSKLAAVGVPAIVLINERGYNHFVVITGIEDGRVLIADPAVGMRSERMGVFENQWSGIFFVILNHASEARASFNQGQNWSLAPPAPVGPNSLTSFMLDLTQLRQVGAGNPTIF
jgi:uncharacterized protein